MRIPITEDRQERVSTSDEQRSPTRYHELLVHTRQDLEYPLWWGDSLRDELVRLMILLDTLYLDEFWTYKSRNLRSINDYLMTSRYRYIAILRQKLLVLALHVFGALLDIYWRGFGFSSLFWYKKFFWTTLVTIYLILLMLMFERAPYMQLEDKMIFKTEYNQNSTPRFKRLQYFSRFGMV